MDAIEAAHLISQHIPGLTVATIEERPHRGWGGDSDAYLVNGALMFRFPRNEDVARALAVELRLLPLLAARSPLSIPNFSHSVHDPTSGLPLFAGYPYIVGAPLTSERFAAIASNVALTERIAAQLGAFLTALHAFPLGVAQACGVPSDADTLQALAADRMAWLRTQVYDALAPDERDYLERVGAAFPTSTGHTRWLTLCHADLTSDHILLAPDGRCLAGIIDFGDMAISDPAGDFVWRYEYGDVFFQRVLDHYGAPLPDRREFTRAVALRYALMPVHQIAWGLANDSAEDVQEGRESLRERMAAATGLDG